MSEAELHDRVEEAPQILPLAGKPSLAVLGRDLRLGTGLCDLLAVESSGRFAVIEIKLKQNQEARRAVVGQVLAYAAQLRGWTLDQLDATVAPYILKRGNASIEDAARSADQSTDFDSGSFRQEASESLRLGAFRLVLVLDEAPDELVQLVGYLESLTDRILIDLIAINSYQIAGTEVVIPVRMQPDRVIGQVDNGVGPKPPPKKTTSTTTIGIDAFVASVNSMVQSSERAQLERYVEWARSLEEAGLARLYNSIGIERWTLLPRLAGYDAGLVTLWNDHGAAYVTAYRTVFQRWAPKTLARLEAQFGQIVGSGNTIRTPAFPDLEPFLTDGYREAAGLLSGDAVQEATSV
jgi:hypothetical protein